MIDRFQILIARQRHFKNILAIYRLYKIAAPPCS